ncbi:hypothetical protein C8R45DRAFT_934604 [Mycena sanguinolenta]|nr:hypothetical protein C8R45DRAFT_934604 [Mycena sanguinolenta]
MSFCQQGRLGGIQAAAQSARAKADEAVAKARLEAEKSAWKERQAAEKEAAAAFAKAAKLATSEREKAEKDAESARQKAIKTILAKRTKAFDAAEAAKLAAEREAEREEAAANNLKAGEPEGDKLPRGLVDWISELIWGAKSLAPEVHGAKHSLYDPTIRDTPYDTICYDFCYDLHEDNASSFKSSRRGEDPLRWARLPSLGKKRTRSCAGGSFDSSRVVGVLDSVFFFFFFRADKFLGRRELRDLENTLARRWMGKTSTKRAVGYEEVWGEVEILWNEIGTKTKTRGVGYEVGVNRCAGAPGIRFQDHAGTRSIRGGSLPSRKCFV